MRLHKYCPPAANNHFVLCTRPALAKSKSYLKWGKMIHQVNVTDWISSYGTELSARVGIVSRYLWNAPKFISPPSQRNKFAITVILSVPHASVFELLM